jgi:hypothetical protein
VSFGDGISARIKIARDAVARHELADASGGKIVVLLADPERFFEGIERVRARASQGELFEGPAADAPPPTSVRWYTMPVASCT